MTDRQETSVDRLINALNDPKHLFTSEQVAFLMAQSHRWGYEQREAEENDKFLVREPVKVLGQWFEQASYRQKCDQISTLPRVNDYQGGPVAWESSSSSASSTQLPAGAHTQMGRAA